MPYTWRGKYENKKKISKRASSRDYNINAKSSKSVLEWYAKEFSYAVTTYICYKNKFKNERNTRKKVYSNG